MKKSSTKLLAVWLLLAVAAGIAALFTGRYILARRSKRAASMRTPALEMAETVAAILPAEEPRNSIEKALMEAVAEAHTHEQEQAYEISTDVPVQAPCIGNLRTLVFHRADSRFLPDEENRHYFASEMAAVQAGYRRAANE